VLLHGDLCEKCVMLSLRLNSSVPASFISPSSFLSYLCLTYVSYSHLLQLNVPPFAGTIFFQHQIPCTDAAQYTWHARALTLIMCNTHQQCLLLFALPYPRTPPPPFKPPFKGQVAIRFSSGIRPVMSAFLIPPANTAHTDVKRANGASVRFDPYHYFVRAP
jgi:hypothetical protein